MKIIYRTMRMFLIVSLFLQINAKPPIVSAQTGAETLYLNLVTPYQKKMCIGQKIELTFFLMDGFTPGPPRLIPGSISGKAVVNIKAKKGKISPSRFIFPTIIKGLSYNGTFSYTMKSKGSDTITITAEYLGFRRVEEYSINGKGCDVSITFNKTTLFSQGQVVIDNTYSGAGTLKITDDGKITGTGSQKIWGAINPYSEGSGSCVQNPPWEGSSGITFSGENVEDDLIRALMELDSLSVNSSTLTCQDEEYSNSMTFPAFTYSNCQVQLEGFDFEGGSLDLNMDCPGEDPYNLSITTTTRETE
jgi:hypothetical protein